MGRDQGSNQSDQVLDLPLIDQAAIGLSLRRDQLHRTGPPHSIVHPPHHNIAPRRQRIIAGLLRNVRHQGLAGAREQHRSLAEPELLSRAKKDDRQYLTENSPPPMRAGFLPGFSNPRSEVQRLTYILSIIDNMVKMTVIVERCYLRVCS